MSFDIAGAARTTDTPTDDRWLRAWAVGYAAVGGAVAAATNPLTTFGLAALVVLAGGVVVTAAMRPTRPARP